MGKKKHDKQKLNISVNWSKTEMTDDNKKLFWSKVWTFIIVAGVDLLEKIFDLIKTSL